MNRPEPFSTSRTRIALGVAATACVLALASCGKSDPPAPATPVGSATKPSAATLQEGIYFNRERWPEFVASVSGLSGAERWGRWSDARNVTITFKEPLPRRFTLEVVGGAFGPNLGKPVRISIGTFTSDVTFRAEPYGPSPDTHRIAVEAPAGAKAIDFAIPQPTSPGGGDSRTLGIGLVRLNVTPQP